MVDCRITDSPGLWQHCSHPISQLDESNFEDGYGFDGSSIRGWKAINESDMLVMPDPGTAFIDPFLAHPTLILICDVVDPITRQPYIRDPRDIAQKAEQYLKQTGVADTAYFGPEAEFFIFDNVRFDSGREQRLLRARLRRSGLEHRPRRDRPTSATRSATRKAISRSRRTTRSRTSAPRCACDGAAGHQDRAPASRSGDGGPGGNRFPVRHAGRDGRQHDALQVRHQERRQASTARR